MSGLNKLKFNLNKYTNKKEVERLIKKQYPYLHKENKKHNIFSKKFLKDKIVLDFSIDIDGVELNKFEEVVFNNNEDFIIFNNDLQDYLFLDVGKTKLNNHFSFYGRFFSDGGLFKFKIPYVVFKNNNEVLIQLLLKEEEGYELLINKLTEAGVEGNQNINCEEIIYSTDDCYQEIKEHLLNPQADKFVLTFKYSDFIHLKNKVFELIKNGKKILTTYHLFEEDDNLEFFEKYGVFDYNCKENIEFNMNCFHSFIKESKERSVWFKIIKRRLNDLLIENGFNQEILFKTFHLKIIHFLDSKFKDTLKEDGLVLVNCVDYYVESFPNNLMALIFSKLIKENLNKRTVKKCLKLILNDINLMFYDYYLLLKSLNKHTKIKFFNGEGITNQTFLKKWLNQNNNLEVFTEEENYCLIREIFEQLEPFVKKYREENGFETDCVLESREEVIFLFNKLLTKINNQLFYTREKPKWVIEDGCSFNFVM